MVYQQVRALLADMEFLKQYNSDSELSDAEIKDIDGKSTRVCRTVYLVTYSQADKSIFPTHSDFAQAVVKSFSHGKARIEQWCCAEDTKATGFITI